MLTTRSVMTSIFFIESSCAKAEISNSLVFAKEIKPWLNRRSVVGGSRVRNRDVAHRFESQLPADEQCARVAVRGSLAVNSPPPSGPPVYPEGGAADEVTAVVVIPDRWKEVAQ